MRPAPAWTIDEHRYLLANLGRMPTAALVNGLYAECGIPRSVVAVRCQAKRMCRLVESSQHLSARQLAMELGCAQNTVLAWINLGLLPNSRAVGHGKGRIALAAEDIAAFVKREACRFDPDAMPPSRWRGIAEVEHRIQRWLTAEQCVGILGIQSNQIRKHCRKRHIPAVQVRRGYGGYPRWWIRLADAVAFAEPAQERMAA